MTDARARQFINLWILFATGAGVSLGGWAWDPFAALVGFFALMFLAALVDFACRWFKEPTP